MSSFFYRWRRSWFWFGLGLLPFAVNAGAMKMDMGSDPALGASAAFDAQGALWLASAHGEHVMLRRSTDLGKTFGTPMTVNPAPEAVYATGENRPKIAFGPAGAVYVQWTEKPAAGWVGDVRFARSGDGGKTFSAPITVNHGTAPATRGFDSLAVAGNGDIVSAWIDGRDSAAAKAAGKPYAGFAFYYTRSSDGGRSFAPERKLMDHSCECCRTTLARAPDGTIAAFFRGIYGDNIRDHAFALLPAGTAPAHAERATFSQWQVAACPDHGPGLAIDAHGVRHAVWYEAKDGPTIWYGQLDPGHAPRHMLKIGGPGASHADVAAHGNTVWLVWNQVNAEGYALMLRRSDDGGLHFAAPRTIATSTHAVGSPQILLRGAHAYAAWNTTDGFKLIDTGAR
ncbi:MAG: exo-alpha-sialidase [Rhodanobacter sp.]|nr:MAG: exo-alpha-sialidase [Rhodanobacter sp.]TAM08764.1 MAG: exo-alpha-sialidase [Rhodanobacter sp.]TAM36806.1 MAG: exo-alpha-sialidase [Rhodanobacter sp.]